MSTNAVLDTKLTRIHPVDPRWIEKARIRQLELTKPPDSLGRLEEVVNRLAAIQETLSPSVASARVVLFAADHGVCAEGVNPYPQAVTAQMVTNFLRGGAAINAVAGAASAELAIVDVGVAHEVPPAPGLIRRPIARGTKNFSVEPAMTRDQAATALSIGIELAEQAAAEGCTLLAIGEMGIGNTTVASALTAALTGMAPSDVVGRGTGADDACMVRKRSAIERAPASASTPSVMVVCTSGVMRGVPRSSIQLCTGPAARCDMKCFMPPSPPARWKVKCGPPRSGRPNRGPCRARTAGRRSGPRRGAAANSGCSP